jgi:hypothetical protein
MSSLHEYAFQRQIGVLLKSNFLLYLNLKSVITVFEQLCGMQALRVA